MIRKTLYLTLCLFVAMPALAQKSKKPASAVPVADARTRNAAPKEYADSAEFSKAFKEFYPLVKPKGTIREVAEKQVDRLLDAMVRQGADSVEVRKAAFQGLDEDAAYKIYYDTYREKLSAKELKAYTAFLKTPEGAKIQSVNMELNRAPSELNRYLTQAVNTNLTPLRTTLRDKMIKDQKAKEEMMKNDTTEVGRRYREQMHVRDSLMQSRGIELKKQ